MATCVLVPGADGSARYWSHVVPHLHSLGHQAIPVDLPISGPRTGLSGVAQVVVDAIGNRRDVMLVAQSLGGFVAPIVCAKTAVELLVMLNAMVPAPHESAGEWWANTRHADARAAYGEFDLMRDFFHDVPPEITTEALSGPPPAAVSDAVWTEPLPLDRWPAVPTRFLQGRDDRFFPLEFQRRVVRERLGIELDDMPGGHLVALSRPRELAEKLDNYWLTRAASA